MPEDIISIITFSDRAEIVQPATRLINRNAIISHVRSIRASGGTEIYQGLSAGIEQLRLTPWPNTTTT